MPTDGLTAASSSGEHVAVKCHLKAAQKLGKPHRYVGNLLGHSGQTSQKLLRDAGRAAGERKRLQQAPPPGCQKRVGIAGMARIGR